MNNLAHAKSASKSTAENSCYGLKGDKFFGKPMNLDIAILASIIFPKDLAVKKAIEEQMQAEEELQRIEDDILYKHFAHIKISQHSSYFQGNHTIDILKQLSELSQYNDRETSDHIIIRALKSEFSSHTQTEKNILNDIIDIFNCTKDIELPYTNTIYYTKSGHSTSVLTRSNNNMCLHTIDAQKKITEIHLPNKTTAEIKSWPDILAKNNLADTSKEEEEAKRKAEEKQSLEEKLPELQAKLKNAQNDKSAFTEANDRIDEELKKAKASYAELKANIDALQAQKEAIEKEKTNTLISQRQLEKEEHTAKITKQQLENQLKTELDESNKQINRLRDGDLALNRRAKGKEEAALLKVNQDLTRAEAQLAKMLELLQTPNGQDLSELNRKRDEKTNLIAKLRESEQSHKNTISELDAQASDNT